MRYVMLAAALVASGAAVTDAAAQSSGAQAQTGRPPQRIRSVTVTGDQQCPRSTADEIIVCSRVDEPYRIPQALRDTGPIAAQNQSWVNRSAQIDQVSRVAGGIPDTCSPIGTGGQSGCALQASRAWAAERRAIRQAQESVP